MQEDVEQHEPPDLLAYYLAQRDVISQGQAGILSKLMLRLTQILLYGHKVQVGILDLGYDCSDYPVATQMPYQPQDYETLADFLEEATGETVATYLSGHGLSAETYEDWVTSELDSEIFDLLQAMALAYLAVDELSEQDEDILSEHKLDWVWQSLESLKLVSLSWMLKAHRAQAEQCQAHKLEQARLAALQRKSNDRIAHRVHQQGRFLLTQAKYEMDQQEQLFAALDSLAEMVSATEMDIYLHSRWFEVISSNRLRQLAQARFAAVRV